MILVIRRSRGCGAESFPLSGGKKRKLAALETWFTDNEIGN